VTLVPKALGFFRNIPGRVLFKPGKIINGFENKLNGEVNTSHGRKLSVVYFPGLQKSGYSRSWEI